MTSVEDDLRAQLACQRQECDELRADLIQARTDRDRASDRASRAEAAVYVVRAELTQALRDLDVANSAHDRWVALYNHAAPALESAEVLRAGLEALAAPGVTPDGEPLPEWVSVDDLRALLAHSPAEGTGETPDRCVTHNAKWHDESPVCDTITAGAGEGGPCRTTAPAPAVTPSAEGTVHHDFD